MVIFKNVRSSSKMGMISPKGKVALTLESIPRNWYLWKHLSHAFVFSKGIDLINLEISWEYVSPITLTVVANTGWSVKNVIISRDTGSSDHETNHVGWGKGSTLDRNIQLQKPKYSCWTVINKAFINKFYHRFDGFQFWVLVNNPKF